jgi:hypothetical protein
MEWRLPVSRSLHLAIILALLLPSGAAAERTAVLVTSAACPVSSVDSLDVRKAYLGVLVSINGNHLRPLRLNGDEQLDHVFFQTIVAMSRKSYERRVISLALRFGTPRPVELEDVDVALEVVRRIECAIVYAWADDVLDEPGIKILKPLWQGE